MNKQKNEHYHDDFVPIDTLNIECPTTAATIQAPNPLPPATAATIPLPPATTASIPSPAAPTHAPANLQEENQEKN